ncbi:MAG: DUF1553 domain-containing protein [Phycisphaeraceae bacterium]|nr:DUF1553 domain-containing protein [Phycisphaeraceae bacterium]
MKLTIRRWIGGPAGLFLFALATAHGGETDKPLPDQISFNRHIRPILSENCFACHGPDAHERKAKLRLDVRTSAVAPRKDGRVVVAGKPAQSLLIQRINDPDPQIRMPPPETHKHLSERQKALLEKWIKQGAEYQKHWSFITPIRPDVPETAGAGWVRNPIDAFVIARLEKAGMKPSPEADRRTLIRRVSFDLTGLPPTPKQVEAFVADKDPKAYEKLVDRLLDSPHFGEHRARYWLDAARYGDTHGLHLDNYREMWPYRDWVVRAFNKNKPYDDFVTEQLAGDLLTNATLEQKVATGFLRAHVTTNEGGSIAEEVYVRNVTDRVETFGTVFLGMTVGCAVCHDHKFDPISQKEFYQLFAYFNSLDGKPMDGNKKAHPPVVTVPNMAHQEQIASLRRKLDDTKKELEAIEKNPGPGFAAWVSKAQSQAGQKRPLPGGALVHYTFDEGKGRSAANAAGDSRDASVHGKPKWTRGKTGKAFAFNGRNHLAIGDLANFTRTSSFSYGAFIKTDGRNTGAVIAKMDEGKNHRGWDRWIQKRQVAMHLISNWDKDAIKVETVDAKILKPNAWHHVFITYDGSSKASGVQIYVDGKLAKARAYRDQLKGPTTTQVPLTLGKRSRSRVKGVAVDEVRIYGRKLSGQEVGLLAGGDPIGPILATPANKRTAQQKQALVRYYLNTENQTFKKLNTEKSKLESKIASLSGGGATTLVWKERAKPKDAYFLVRGQYDQKGQKVSRGLPEVFPGMPSGAPNDRLGLARWLLDEKHPLMARVAVNRFWQQIFGTGLVKTSEDFGSQGEPPSHPQLLDYLAVEFRTGGWDVKKLIKQIVTSATYRQTSAVSPKLYKRDPENRLLGRGPRFRLDAEMLRDNALAVSGLLVRKLGGPSVKPPQPDGLWFAVGYSGSNTVRFKADKGPEKVHRRSIYTFWKRTSPPPQMSTFDAPSRESCAVRRERTNTPLQALLLMNDPQYIEAARALGERMLKEGGKTPSSRIAFAVKQVLLRPIKPTEATVIEAFYKRQLAEYHRDAQAAKKLIAVGQIKPDPALDPAELAACTMVANLLLNTDEVINKN